MLTFSPSRIDERPSLSGISDRRISSSHSEVLQRALLWRERVIGWANVATSNRAQRQPDSILVLSPNDDSMARTIAGGYRELGLDALIGIGGDGSFAILRKLAQQCGMNLVGVPMEIRCRSINADERFDKLDRHAIDDLAQIEEVIRKWIKA